MQGFSSAAPGRAERRTGSITFAVLGLVGVFLAGCQTAKVVPAHVGDEVLPVQGPEQATGAVVYSHGSAPWADGSQYPAPRYMEAFHRAGWDIFSFKRPRGVDRALSNAAQLIEHTERFKAEGYRQVVLAGQSYGGWSSLMAASKSNVVDAVLAAAPACCGHGAGLHRNALDLYPMLRRIEPPTRVALFFFRDDPFNPGGRPKQAERILRDNGVPFLILDEPIHPNIEGHGGAYKVMFGTLFGERLIRFASGVEPVFKGVDIAVDWSGRPNLTGRVLAVAEEDDGLLRYRAPDGRPCVIETRSREAVETRWTLICSGRGLAAFGTLDRAAEPHGKGVGKDNDDAPVTLTLLSAQRPVDGFRTAK